MRIARVIGTVTLSRRHPLLEGAAWRVVMPLGRSGLRPPHAGGDESFVTYDELGAGLGSLVAISEGAEASAPFHPNSKPIDAYNAAILDVIDLD